MSIGLQYVLKLRSEVEGDSGSSAEEVEGASQAIKILPAKNIGRMLLIGVMMVTWEILNAFALNLTCTKLAS